jgi:hypothetical protein
MFLLSSSHYILCYLYSQANLMFPTAYAEAARGLWVTSASSPKYPPFEIRLIWNTVMPVFNPYTERLKQRNFTFVMKNVHVIVGDSYRMSLPSLCKYFHFNINRIENTHEERHTNTFISIRKSSQHILNVSVSHNSTVHMPIPLKQRLSIFFSSIEV